MKKVFMVHRFMGQPNEIFFPWLMRELDKMDVYACSLPMPTPNDPKKEEWVKVISDAVSDAEDEIFLVGCSLGVAAVMRYLEELKSNRGISGAVLISGPCEPLNVEDKSSRLRKIDHFLTPKFDFEKIRKSVKTVKVIHGDDDPKVPFHHAKVISENLKAELIVVPNAGHFDDYFELPEALQALKEMFI